MAIFFRSSEMVCMDVQRRICLKVNESDKVVEYIQFDPSGPMRVQKVAPAKFNAEFRAYPAYPPQRCAALYLGYAGMTGASQAALEALAKFTKVLPGQMKALVKEAV